ncbi:MAG: hypothetical protein ACLQPH_06155 [Acidimicrobiales bacterium]
MPLGSHLRLPGRRHPVAACLVVVATVVGAVTVGLVTSPSAADAGVTASTEVITEPGTLTALDSGGSATTYGVVLPANASCPGDTAHHAYHVFSYLVPQGVSPSAVSFKTGIPSEFYGFISYGSYFGAVNTAEGTGQVVGIPTAFIWSRLTPKELFPASQKTAIWDGGIACADTHGVVTNYWNSKIEFTASSTDPGGFTWRVLHPATVSSGGVGLWVGVALLGLAIVLGLVALLLSRRRRTEGPLPPARPEPGPAAPTSGTPADGGRPADLGMQHVAR